MDPLYQTLLTLACMYGSYLWGNYSGVVSIQEEITRALRCREIRYTKDGKVIFIDRFGNVRKSEDAFK